LYTSPPKILTSKETANKAGFEEFYTRGPHISEEAVTVKVIGVEL
jgi:hypothetical protein